MLKTKEELQDSLFEELGELEAKRERLAEFVKKHGDELSLKSKTLLRRQEAVMYLYAQILADRIQLAGEER